MKRIFLICASIILLTSVSWAQPVRKPVEKFPALATIPEETKELVRRLLEANGTRESMNRIFLDIIQNAPPESQEELRTLLRSDALIDRVIPIYAKHFTPEELKELVTFYKSPVGSKNLKLAPQLMTEVMDESVRYFEENAKTLQTGQSATSAK